MVVGFGVEEHSDSSRPSPGMSPLGKVQSFLPSQTNIFSIQSAFLPESIGSVSLQSKKSSSQTADEDDDDGDKEEEDDDGDG